jgi:hypothetical protein
MMLNQGITVTYRNICQQILVITSLSESDILPVSVPLPLNLSNDTIIHPDAQVKILDLDSSSLSQGNSAKLFNLYLHY